MKKALRGLSDIKLFKITENTEASYKVEATAKSLPYAQKLTREDKSSSDPIYADDNLYDDEEVIEGEDMELTIPEADLESFPILEGGSFDATTKEYSWGGNVGDEYGMTFKSKKKDGTFRMFRYYRVKFKKVKQDLNTQDNGTSINSLVVTLTAYRRAFIKSGEAVPLLRTYKDTTLETQTEDLKWLDTIPTMPATTPAG